MTLSPANLIPRTLTGLVSILSGVTLTLVGWLCLSTIETNRNLAVLTSQFHEYKQTGGIPDYWQREIEANRNRNQAQDETILRLVFMLKAAPMDTQP